MKLNPIPPRGLICGTLAGLLFAAAGAIADPAKPSAVQIDLGHLLDTRVIFTQKDGQLQKADHSLDRGDSSVLITQSAAEVSNAGKLVPLPDAGFFAANQEHPDVQLAYGTAGAGPQVHQTTARSENFSFPVPTNHYSRLQLFFISAQGPTPISVKVRYADGSADERATLVPDFYFLPKPADQGWFVLADNFGKVNAKGLMTEFDHHYVHGFNLDPDPAKQVQQVEITKQDSGSVLNLFGATGTVAAAKTP
jgi:hypothetical protein